MSAIDRFCEPAAPSRVAGREPAAHLRQQHGSGRHADDPEGQLVEPLRVIDRGHGAGGQERGEDRVGEDGDLLARRADHRRSQGGEELPNVAVEPRDGQALENAAPTRLGHQQHELGQPRDGDAPARGDAGVGKQEREGEKSHDEEIEHDRGEGPHAEKPMRVQGSRMQSRERYERQIGKRDARHAHGEGEFLRVLFEARRDEFDELRRVQIRQRQQRQLRDQQQRENSARKNLRALLAFGDQHPRIGRHIGRTERALAEDGAKLVRQAKGDEKRVGQRAGAQDRRDHEIARESRQPRQRGEPAYGNEVSVHALASNHRWEE